MDGEGYQVTFNSRDKGKQQYVYLIELKKDGTSGVSNTAVSDLLRTNNQMSQSIDTVPQPGTGVKPSICNRNTMDTHDAGAYAGMNSFSDATVEQYSGAVLETADYRTGITTARNRQAETRAGPSFAIYYPQFSETDIKNNSIKLQTMPAVEHLTGNEFERGTLSLKEQVLDFFAGKQEL